MNGSDLIGAAEALLASNKGRPTAASRNRAVSTVYYAMFHCLAQDCADLLIGRTSATRSAGAWRQVYRSLEHGLAKTQCTRKQMMSKFPKEIADFGELFVAMQGRRHQADYDPLMRFTKSSVALSLEEARRTIANYLRAATRDRRAFAAYVLLKQRTD